MIHHLTEIDIAMNIDSLEVTHYGVEYQPFVNCQTGKITAYEALARFFRSDNSVIPANQVFDALHGNRQLLSKVELLMKKLQITQAPPDDMLFINLDPHSMIDASARDMLKLFHSRSSLIIELIENTNIQDASDTLALHQLLNQQNIPTALDDIGARQSMISIDLIANVQWLKFDRCWLALLSSPTYEKLFRCLLEFARSMGRKTVLEGIETKDHMELAKSYPIDFLQGFLFRECFIQSELYSAQYLFTVDNQAYCFNKSSPSTTCHVRKKDRFHETT